MATANINKPNGTKITIEGTPEEITNILQALDVAMHKKSSSKVPLTLRGGTSTRKPGLTDHIMALEKEGYFNKPHTLNEVKEALDQKAHIYPVTSISPTLVRLVRSKALRRLRGESQWTYVKA